MKGTDSKKIAEDRKAAGIKTPDAPRMPMYVVELDGYELAEFYNRREELIPKHNQHLIHGIHFGSNWSGSVSSWNDAEKLLREGWPEGAEQAKKLAAGMLPLLPPPESLRRRVKWGEDGGELDRDRLYSQGIETAFRTTRQFLQRSPRVVRIVANWSLHCGYSAKQVAWHGAAITSLVDLLENADFRVELSLAFPTRQYAMKPVSVCMPVVRIKTPTEPLNINSVAAIAGHAGIYRTFGFAAEMSSPYGIQESLGSCLTAREAWTQGVESGVLEPVDAFMEVSAGETNAFRNVASVLNQLMPEDKEMHDRLKSMIDLKAQGKSIVGAEY
jgi:hypothetical protein